MEEREMEDVNLQGLYQGFQGGKLGLNMSPGVSGKSLNAVEKTIEAAKTKGFDTTDYDVMKNEIERIAWNVFLNRSGLSFKHELPDDVKKKITDAESYHEYRDIAIKIYYKKQLAVLNKKYPIIDVPASGKPCWRQGAYTLMFVYSKHHGNFILRGYIGEVKKYLKENYTHYFCYKSMWHNSESRGHWDFWKKDIGIFEPDKSKRNRGRNGERKYIVRQYSSNIFGCDEDDNKVKNELVLKFKRLPKWILVLIIICMILCIKA